MNCLSASQQCQLHTPHSSVWDALFVSSLLGSTSVHVGSRCGERTRGCHRDVIVGILRLRAAHLVQAVAWRMLLELGVHVPADLLSSSLRVVELLLGSTLERLKLVLKNFQFFLSTSLSLLSSGLIWANLSGFGRNCDH